MFYLLNSKPVILDDSCFVVDPITEPEPPRLSRGEEDGKRWGFCQSIRVPRSLYSEEKLEGKSDLEASTAGKPSRCC